MLIPRSSQQKVKDKAHQAISKHERNRSQGEGNAGH